MGDALIYVGIHAIKPGMVDVAKSAAKDLTDHLAQNHPRLKHFEIDIDEAELQMTVIQIHPDEESLLLHLDLAREKIKAAYEFLERTVKVEIYGTPSSEVATLISQMGMGAPVRFNEAAAGFSRLT